MASWLQAAPARLPSFVSPAWLLGAFKFMTHVIACDWINKSCHLELEHGVLLKNHDVKNMQPLVIKIVFVMSSSLWKKIIWITVLGYAGFQDSPINSYATLSLASLSSTPWAPSIAKLLFMQLGKHFWNHGIYLPGPLRLFISSTF